MSQSPLRVHLTDERRELMHLGITRFFAEHFDQSVSEFQASELLDFFVRELGAPVYNQAIKDARSFLQNKLDDLEGEFYEPEDPYAS